MKLDLSDVLRKLDVTIDYFRMDIEGFEVEVVKGMVETLTTSARPDGPGGSLRFTHDFLMRMVPQPGYSSNRWKHLGITSKPLVSGDGKMSWCTPMLNSTRITYPKQGIGRRFSPVTLR